LIIVRIALNRITPMATMDKINIFEEKDTVRKDTSFFNEKYTAIPNIIEKMIIPGIRLKRN